MRVRKGIVTFVTLFFCLSTSMGYTHDKNEHKENMREIKGLFEDYQKDGEVDSENVDKALEILNNIPNRERKEEREEKENLHRKNWDSITNQLQSYVDNQKMDKGEIQNNIEAIDKELAHFQKKGEDKAFEFELAKLLEEYKNGETLNQDEVKDFLDDAADYQKEDKKRPGLDGTIKMFEEYLETGKMDDGKVDISLKALNKRKAKMDEFVAVRTELLINIKAVLIEYNRGATIDLEKVKELLAKQLEMRENMHQKMQEFKQMREDMIGELSSYKETGKMDDAKVESILTYFERRKK